MKTWTTCGLAALAVAALTACQPNPETASAGALMKVPASKASAPASAATPSVAAPSTAASAASKELTMTDPVKTASGLQYIDTQVGSGAEAKPGHQVLVHYTGWLYNNGVKGEKFDSSVDRGQPFAFALGQGMVIKGWDEGVAGMKIGGKRTLIIPSELGYGARGAGGVIPPNATLMFDVELLDLR